MESKRVCFVAQLCMEFGLVSFIMTPKFGDMFSFGAGRVLATGNFFFTNEARFLIEESESGPQSFPWRVLVVSVCTKWAPRNQLLE